MESQRKCRFEKRNHFTNLEDKAILDAVQNFGQSNLVLIASFVTTCIPNQCKMRYLSNLNPTLNFVPFKKEENEILRGLIDRFGTCWRILSKCFNEISKVSIKSRWNSLLVKK
jgi:hypothetical protein